MGVEKRASWVLKASFIGVGGERLGCL